MRKKTKSHSLYNLYYSLVSKDDNAHHVLVLNSTEFGVGLNIALSQAMSIKS